MKTIPRQAYAVLLINAAVNRLRREKKSILIDEDFARISCFCRTVEFDFQHLAGPRNVSVDLKYDVLCLGVFVYGIPLESG